MTSSTQSSTTPTGRDLAAGTKDDRNRAVDAYRALAMVAVAFGHWAAIAVSVDSNNSISGGNALEFAPSMSWITWIFQVMPLFFVVGGFASAMSLDTYVGRNGGSPHDWVASRLRRMLAPTVVLATTWMAIMAASALFGVTGLASTALIGAAIPLWFLANYTIDTAIAPYLLPRFRSHRGLVASLLGGTFIALEVARFAGVAVLPELNWVLGWLIFQVVGFAWRDGVLPTGRTLVAAAAALWATAVALVAFGPWPVAMVNFPGVEHSPTHPPTLALLAFGMAYSATAIAAAPAVTRFLSSDGAGRTAWLGVIGANSMAMTVYLWHMTAATAATVVVWQLGLVPTAEVGTGSWWLQKLPLVGLSAIMLAAIVAVVGKVERRALLSTTSTRSLGMARTIGVAALVSTAIKAWSSGSAPIAVGGCLVLIAVWHLALKPATTARLARPVR
jgi:hypothetical protein